jgi:hypothetical protein
MPRDDVHMFNLFKTDTAEQAILSIDDLLEKLQDDA